VILEMIFLLFLVFACLVSIARANYLGNQSYEAGITILNVQSYPAVGGNWTVRFNTYGKADLAITAVNGTEFGRDLKFLEVMCGDEVLDYEWVNNSVFIEDYECGETVYEISKVLIAGKHTLEFKFGDDVEYAYNSPGTITNIGTNVAFTDNALDFGGSHTLVAGSDRMVFVFIGYENDNTIDVSGVTYGGQTCNKAHDQITGTSGYRALSEIWYCNESALSALSPGSQTVSIDATGTAGAIESNAYVMEFYLN